MVAMAIVSFERGDFFPGLRFHGVFLCIPIEGPVFIYYYVLFIKPDYPYQRGHDNRFRITNHNGFAHGDKGKETTGYGRGGLTTFTKSSRSVFEKTDYDYDNDNEHLVMAWQERCHRMC